MWQYIIKRILLMIPTLFGAALVVFLLMHVVPGDIALLILGTGEQGGDVNLQDLERLRKKWGLTARSMSSSCPGSGVSCTWTSGPHCGVAPRCSRN